MKLSISMTRRETILGWIHLLFSLFALPVVLYLINGLLNGPLSDTEVNLAFMGLNFLAVGLIFRRFLTSSVKAAANRPWRVLTFAAAGFALYYLGSIAIATVIVFVSPDFSNVNDNAVIGLFQEHAALMSIFTVLLVPVAEETLYRGLLFQGFQRKSRLLAYCLSTVIFAGIHVVGYIGSADLITLCLCFAQYLPAGITLAWAYEKADTIAAPMLMHMIINMIGTTAAR